MIYLTEIELYKLRKWADILYKYYEQPVYLCGSTLKSKKHRDVDIRIILPDLEFGCRYGEKSKAIENTHTWISEGLTGLWNDIRWKWSKDCVKKTRQGWMKTNLNIDFQIYPKSYCGKYKNLLKERIDTKENNNFRRK
jgi:hypothetical protein